MPSSEDFADAVATLGIKAAVQPREPSPSGLDSVDILLSRGPTRQRYSVLLNRTDRLDDLARLPHLQHPAMLFAPFVPPRTAGALRNAGVQYIDQAGNAWIEFGDVLIDIRGRARQRNTPASPSRIVATNVFSPTRAQVVFALLAWPELWKAPRRELAEAAGVSVGLVQDTVTRLLEAGMDRTDRDPGLLERWTLAFPSGLGKKLTLAEYRGTIDSIQAIEGRDAFVSGEVAADQLVRPASAVLYVDRNDPNLALQNRWRTDGTANIVVRRMFWQDPRGAVNQHGVRQAPWPLVYADLATSEDPRVRDVATEWRDRFADVG